MAGGEPVDIMRTPNQIGIRRNLFPYRKPRLQQRIVKMEEQIQKLVMRRAEAAERLAKVQLISRCLERIRCARFIHYKEPI